MKSPAHRLYPMHPGELLRERYLVALNISVSELATHLHLPAKELEDVVNQRRPVSADMAARLARYFGGDAHTWLMVQADYDLKTLPNRDAIERDIEPLFPPT
ncbi:HigA family addiction module antitoxin [Lysobacter sp. LF1]|uniref:HigA family addiction module antitoxin n=1 Tax=Lysobacter stagni TaxID=3045172 RepID=A0ABT6XL33_9GAMM|nr:HigA family addiction module antitoxin [Lysobacter sp. LF1]MDI9240758.1 HigA family addiction module antitoxin [Lysobacter sp. LF1]